MSPRRIGWISCAVAVVLVAVAAAALGGFTWISTVAVGGVLGSGAGIVAYRIAAAACGRDRAEALLALATAGLPPRRAEWGVAMRAELAAIDDIDARRRFAHSASVAALGHGLGLQIAISVGTGVVVGAVALTASRVQLQDGSPGILGLTVFVPAILLLAVALATAYAARSFRFGLATGALALTACFAAVAFVVALEGLVWMDRHGVFVLDADPPRHAVDDVDVIFDLFTTGMWLGHLIFWLPWPVIGAAIGARLGGDPASRGASRLA